LRKKQILLVTLLAVATLLFGCSNSVSNNATAGSDEKTDAGVKPSETTAQTIIDDVPSTDNGYFYEFGYFLEISELDKSPEEMVEKWKNGDTSPFRTVELSYNAKDNYTELHFPGQETIYVSCQGEITPGVKMKGAEYDVSDGSILRTYEYYVWWEGNALYINTENTKPDEKSAYFMKE